MVEFQVLSSFQSITKLSFSFFLFIFISKGGLRQIRQITKGKYSNIWSIMTNQALALRGFFFFKKLLKQTFQRIDATQIK